MNAFTAEARTACLLEYRAYCSGRSTLAKNFSDNTANKVNKDKRAGGEEGDATCTYQERFFLHSTCKDTPRIILNPHSTLHHLTDESRTLMEDDVRVRMRREGE